MKYCITISETAGELYREVRVEGEDPAGVIDVLHASEVKNVEAPPAHERATSEYIARAKHIEAFENGVKHERQRIAADLQACRDAAEKLKADRAALSKELEIVNAKLSYAVAEATRQDAVREKLKAELATVVAREAALRINFGNALKSRDESITSLAEVCAERDDWRERALALENELATVRARAEAAEAKLLTPSEAKEIAATYRDFVKVDAPTEFERPSFYRAELSAIERATRGS